MYIKSCTKLFNFGIISISLIIIFTTAYLSQDCHLWGDDVGHSTYEVGEKLFDCLKFNFGSGYEGGYIGYFFAKFFSFRLPLLLNIHPQDFMSWGHGFIKGIFLVLILLSISKFTQLYKKSNTLFLITFVLSFMFFVHSTLTTQATVITCNYLFYRYCFPLLFFSIFSYHILEGIINKNPKYSYKHLFFVSVCSFILGTSSEIMIYMSILFCFMMLFYNFTIKLINKIIKKKYTHLNLDKNFFIPLSCLLIAPLIHKTGIRGTSAPVKNISLGQDVSFETLKEFTYHYFNILFQLEYVIWILIIISIYIFWHKANSRNEKNKMLPTFFILSTILLIYFLLYFFGQTGTLITIPECKFYLSHCNLRFLFKMLLLYPIYINLSYILKNSKKTGKNIFTSFLWGIIVILLIFNIKITTINMKYSFNLETIKKMHYIAEKIMRFYQIQNKVAQIPNNHIEYTLPIFDFFDKNECAFISLYRISYYDTVYKIDNKEDIKNVACRSNIAIQKFYAEGGIITLEELNDVKFERLYNENFVTNKLYENFLFTRKNNYYIFVKNGISFSSINFNNNLL